MVMAGRSVHITTFCLDKLKQAVNQYFVHMLSLVTDNMKLFHDQSPGKYGTGLRLNAKFLELKSDTHL